MICYFSGTGNSKFVAEYIGKLMGEEVRPLTFCPLEEVDSLGIIFPVYAWGLPKVVEDYIYYLKGVKVNYLWTVMTCGDDMGYADKVMNKLLNKVGLTLNAAFSVQMPNTYVCLPGFDIDSEEVAERKVKTTKEKLPAIAEKIRNRENVVDVVRGPIPFIYTYILRPLFNATLVTDKFFKTNDDCSNCGKCAKDCSLKNIEMSNNGTPTWKGKCTGCLRCYHECPKHALHFGSMTNNKGQKKNHILN